MANAKGGGLIRMIQVPLVAMLLLAVPVSIYLIKIRSERESLKNRNFRLLAMLSDQVRTKVNSYQSVISSAARETHPEFHFGRFLASQGLGCDKAGCEQDPPPGESTGATKIWRLDDGSGVVIEYKGAKTSIRRRIDAARRVIEPLANETGDTFDDLVVADQADGRVIFQQSRSGLRFTSVDPFLPHDKVAGRAKEGDSGKKEEAKEPGSLRFTTGLVEVEISGSSYLIFQQPVQFSFLRGETDEPAEWLICGVVRADRFLSDSMQVSYTWLIALTGLALLPVLGWPVIKLHFMTHRERLTMRDVFLNGFSLLAGASLASLLILHLYSTYRLERESDEQLLRVALDLKNDLHSELSSMIAQLRTFNGQLAKPAAAPQAETNYLHDLPHGRDGVNYPWFDIAYWTDPQGRQIIKRITSSSFTPFIPITDRPIYRSFAGLGERWYLQGLSEGFLLFATNTPTTGENQAVLAVENKAGKSNAWAPYSFISNRPITLFRPVLPPGFGFAFVSRNGYVLFHSNSNRNQQENFFDETDGSTAVRSAVMSNAGMFATATYMGRDHSMYVSPVTRLQNNQWALVVFRDATVTGTVELETVSSAAESLFLYLVVVCLVAAVAYWRSRSAGLRSNLLPGGMEPEAYRRLCGLFLVLLVCWLVRALTGSPESVAVEALAVSATALCLVAAEVAGWMPRHASIFARLMPHSAGYATFALALIVLIGMIPAAALFRSARTVQHALYIRWGQEKMARQVEARLREGLRLERAYKVDPAVREQFRSEFEVGKDRMKMGDFHRAFFDTRLEPAQDGIQRHGTESSSFNWLLSRMTPPVNKVAVELHAQRARRIEDHSWLWEVGDENVTLRRLGPRQDAPSRFTMVTGMPGKKTTDKVDLLARGSAMLALALVGLVTVVLLRRVVQLLFPPVYAPQATAPQGLDGWTGDVLAIGPQGSGKTGWAMALPGAVAIDYSQDSAATVPEGSLLVLDNFERELASPDANQRKLETIERIVYGGKHRLALISGVEPHYWFWSCPDTAGLGPAPEVLSRWAAVLCRFREYRFPPNRDLDGNSAHWDAIWSLCTPDERTLMMQLAHGGIVNPKSAFALEQLVRKGLVIDPPAYRLASATLEAFVRLRGSADELTEMEAQTRSGWRNMRSSFGIFVVGLIGIVMVAQREMLESWVPYVTGIAGGAATLIRLLKGKEAPKLPED